MKKQGENDKRGYIVRVSKEQGAVKEVTACLGLYSFARGGIIVCCGALLFFVGNELRCCGTFAVPAGSAARRGTRLCGRLAFRKNVNFFAVQPDTASGRHPSFAFIC